MATTVTRYVNTASTAGGDGTTNATSGATRAYAGLQAAITAQASARPNLVSNDELLYVLCEGTAADTAPVIITGFTTDSTRYVWIAGNSTAAGRHLGVWSASHYRVQVNAASAKAIVDDEEWTRIEGIQAYNSNAGSEGVLKVFGLAGTVTYEGLILRGGDIASPVIFQDQGTASMTVRNCVVYGGSDGIASSGATTLLENVTIAGNSARGVVRNAGTLICRNCYAGGSGSGADYASTGTYTNCRSEDGSQSTTVVDYSVSAGAYFVNITAGSEDFHLGASSALIGAGTDLSGTFTTDIDNQTRSVPWDIGADEFVAAISFDKMRSKLRGHLRGVRQ